MQKILNFSSQRYDVIYDCYDEMVMVLCDYFGVNRDNSFCWRWGFNYEHQQNDISVTLYDQLYVNQDQTTVCKLAERYLGIEIHGYHYQHVCNLDELVMNKINQNLPVGLVVDTSECPWNPLYHKQKIRHCSLIIGYEDQYYYVLEPFLNFEVFKIEKSQFSEPLIMSVMDISYSPTDEHKKSEMILDGFRYVHNNGKKIESIHRYANEMKQSIEADLVDELTNEDVRYIPSLRAFKNLGTERKGLLEFFTNNRQYMEDSTFHLLEECVEKWELCLTRLIRVYLTRKPGKIDSIVEMLHEIAELELNIFDQTVMYLSDSKMNEV